MGIVVCSRGWWGCSQGDGDIRWGVVEFSGGDGGIRQGMKVYSLGDIDIVVFSRR